MMRTDYDYEGKIVQEPQGWLDQLDWGGLRQEVEVEARAEIALLGLGNAGKSTLFNSLRGWPVTMTALKLGRLAQTVEEPLGLFTLIDLPEDGNLDDGLLERLDRAALLVYLLDGAVGCSRAELAEAIMRPADFRWISRLRATGRPMLVVLNKADLWDGWTEAVMALVEQRVGVEVLPVSAYDSAEAQRHFVERMVETCPDLAVPLGQELATFRRALAQRLIRRAATLCGLVAVEPIPLVDLPVQVGSQVGLVARIGAMYGHPPTSDYSKELVLTGAGSVALRLLCQQAAKAVPVVGWAASGLLAAATTWLVGQTALAYFDGQITPNSIGRMLCGLWQKRLGLWCRQIVGVGLRYCPLSWALQWSSRLWERWKVKRRVRLFSRNTSSASREETRDELVETKAT